MYSPKVARTMAWSAAVALLILSPNPALWAHTVADGLTVSDAQQPRDPRNEVARPETQLEQDLKAATAAEPTKLPNWLQLAKLQETRGAIEDAERTYKMALDAVGPNKELLTSTARFFTRTGRFDLAIGALEAAADVNPADHAGHLLVATYYWEKTFKDTSLAPADKLKYIDAGIAATDRALSAKADYVEALTYKNILLRMKAQAEPDAAKRDAFIAEADALKAQAMELQKTTSGAAAPAGAPPPGAPIRVGGDVKTPTKIQHVNPVYPQEAQEAKVSGMVIIEATIDIEGSVETTKVLRSVPMLDQAALDAVKQWRFTPTMLNGAPVPVIMTVTVNFTLQ